MKTVFTFRGCQPSFVVVFLLTVSCAIPCLADGRTSSKSKVTRVTSPSALRQIEKVAQRAVANKVLAQIQRDKRALAAVERETKKQAKSLASAFQRQRGADAFLKQYRSSVASLERARTPQARSQATAAISRHFAANRALTQQTMTVAKTDLSKLVAVTAEPLSKLYGPLKPRVGKNGEIIWVVDNGGIGRGTSRGNSGSTGNQDDEEPFEPQPTDFCLTGDYSQTYNSYLPDDDHPGTNTTIDASEGEITSDIYAVAGFNPLGDSVWNWAYVGEVVIVPAGHTSLTVSVDLTYTREWSIQAVGHAQAAGWLELNLVQLPQNYGSVDIGSSSVDDSDSYELDKRWVVAGQDDIPPPDQPPSPVDVTLDITRTIPNSERSYLVFVGGTFRADATGIAACAHAKTNIKIHQICVRAEP